jgi:predicted membrane chloride channel (bestrophin family)
MLFGCCYLSMCCLDLLLLQNRTYDRWWQARSALGGIGGGLTNIVRQIATYTDDPVVILEAQKWSMCMVYGELGRAC